MCGRFLLTTDLDLLERAFGFDKGPRPNLQPRYNVAPTDPIPIVRRNREGTGRELAVVRWGLIPFWAKDASVGGAKLINARAESVTTKPAFREAFERRRCLVPADGFYEWQKRADGKQPWLIRRRDHQPFGFAGLWDRWKGPGGPVETATIITTEPNAVCAPLHNRMPVILAPDTYDAWLDPDRPGGEALLRPCPDDWLEVFPISRLVNNVRNDGPELIEPERHLVG